jgi:3' terminal RNA ribose 2'-O-methyltransferase Hen1
LRKLFEPLGYAVRAQRHTLDTRFPEWGESAYYTVELSKETTVMEFFNHLYVMIPVLDNHKHYYVDKSEIDKLIKRGEGWLANHPEKETIARRFLKNSTSYTREALERLIEVNPADEEAIEEKTTVPEDDVESSINLNEERLGSVLAVLKSAHAESVVDLGCGEGKLLKLLLKEKSFKKIVGLDVSIRSLEKASERLNLQELAPLQKERIQLLHGSLMYRDSRLSGFDAAAIIEVIEHLDVPRLRAFERVVFEFARPKMVVLTSPNREYNVLWDTVGPDKLRHSDHRFEWTRAEFSEWANNIAQKYGYTVRFLPIGKEAKDVGAPTQMAIFTGSATNRI